jgi:hypothetical protein
MPNPEAQLSEPSALVAAKIPSSPIVQRATPVSISETTSPKSLHRWLCLWVLALAIYQFSETTADPDLWGHVVFGQNMIKTHAVERTEIYSWTAPGQPFVNHEYGADILIGATHLLLGGTGILLLKLLIGLASFLLCLRLASKALPWPGSAVAWVFGAVAVVEISFGFAARPQIFTALCLVLEMMLLRRIYEGSHWWAAALPILFVFWINVHGGALAGVGLLLLATGATTLEFFERIRKPFAGESQKGQNSLTDIEENDDRRITNREMNLGTLAALWLASFAVVGALFGNPWGAGLVKWLIKSVLWFRPEIEEWNPTPLGWDHATLFILVAVSAFAWISTRRRRVRWELAVCGAFAVLALRSVRNAPLFGLVALALVPPHLADALARFRDRFARLLEFWRQENVQKIAVGSLAATCALIVAATFTLHKEHPFTMEIPRERYPTAAVDFMRDHHLKGKLLVFFDWGDLAIFNLAGTQVSIDGRLDAAYSRPLIAQHWKFYNDEDVDSSILRVDDADLALLPSKLAGALGLRNRPGWRPVYFDNTAVVLARDPQRFASLTGIQLPIQGAPEGASGRAAFPDRALR